MPPTRLKLKARRYPPVHTGTESRFLSIKSISAVSWPILMPNTANWGF